MKLVCYRCVSGWFKDVQGLYQVFDNPYPEIGPIQYIEPIEEEEEECE